jgi:hypothetical protein
MARMYYALRMKDRLDRFPLSNLGNVAALDSDAPFRLKDLRLYVHSFRIGALGLVTYTANGEMRFFDGLGNWFLDIRWQPNHPNIGDPLEEIGSRFGFTPRERWLLKGGCFHQRKFLH